MKKEPYHKVVLATGLVCAVTVALLCAAHWTEKKKLSFGLPTFTDQNGIQQELHSLDYTVEKIVQSNDSGTDMRAPVFLTQHRFLLEQIAKIEVEFHARKYTLNDLCYKPHTAIFESKDHVGPLPQHLRRLHLEMRRLSPCLISTPLNCFYDSYLVHSQIGKWNVSVDFLNRRLRNSYLETTKSFEAAPYVKANSGPEVVEGWAQHMLSLSREGKKDDAWFENVKRWLSSIAPRQKVCADPMRSCDKLLDAENYFNICTVIQNFNDIGQKRNQTLKFQLESADIEFTTNLDCVNDREMFIEWMKEHELRSLLNTLAPGVELPDTRAIVNQRCEGIFHDVDAEGVEFFDTSRSFANVTSPFDSLRSELALMTPQNLLKTMKDADEVNGFESIWTEKRATEVLELFLSALRNEVNKFNEHRASKKVSVTSRMEDPIPPPSEIPSWDVSLYFFLVCYTTVTFAFLAFAWEKQRRHSLGIHLFRDVCSALFFILVYSNDGVFVWNLEKIHFLVISGSVNLFLTTRMTFCRQRILRCVQRVKQVATSSNFSSLTSRILGLTGDKNESEQEIRDAIHQLTKYMAGFDMFSEEKYEMIPSFWALLAFFILPLCLLYWYFVDTTCLEILILALPALLIAAIEEWCVKRHYREQRQKCRKGVKAISKGEHLSQKQMFEVLPLRITEVENEKRKELGMPLLELPPEPLDEDGFPLREKLIKSGSNFDINEIVAFPNRCNLNFRMKTLGMYFWLLKVGQRALIFPIVAFVAIFISIGVLFVPMSRMFTQFGSINHDSLSIDIEIREISIDWDEMNVALKNFTNEIESIESLHLISNWQKSFERFNERMEKIKRIEKWEIRTPPPFSEWRRKEPINWAITASLASPDHKSRAPNPFQFRLRYDLSETHNVTRMIETVERLDAIFEKYSSRFFSITGVGQIYEHYHRMAVVWNRYAFQQLLAAAILVVLVSCITFLFATRPRLSTTLLFSILVVGPRIVTTAVVWLLSIENYQIFTNFALLVGFLAAWHPFCDLCRFRSRLFFKRTHPELANSHHRIRIPFVAAVDVAHIFGILIPVSVFVAIVSAVFPSTRFFFFPTVLLVLIQLLALFFAVAVVAVARQMFEPSVRTSLRTDLEGGSTQAQIYALTNKRRRDVAPEMELQVIHPDDRMNFWAPKGDPTSEEDPSEEDPETNELENSPQPGPSVTRQETPRFAAFTSCGIESLRASELPSPQTIDSSKIPLYEPLPDHFYMRVDLGAPLDSSIPRLPGKPLDEHIAEAAESYEIDEEEEEEDVHSRGEPDEETMAVEAEILARWRRQAEQSGATATREEVRPVPQNNEPGPSDDRRQCRQAPEINSGHRANEEVTNRAATRSGAPPPVATRSVYLSQVLAGAEAPLPGHGYVVYDCPIPTDYVLPANFYYPGRAYEPLFRRTHPRDPLTEPPNWVEIMQANDDPCLGEHPRAEQYPAHYSRTEIAYCEDPYWTQRTVPLPEGLRVPPRPRDLLTNIRRRPIPAEDVDWQPAAHSDTIPMPPEYFAFVEERRRAFHRRRDAEERVAQDDRNKRNRAN